MTKAKKSISFPYNEIARQSSSNDIDEDVEMKAELEIKKEKASPTPEREVASNDLHEIQSNVENINARKITVRKDLVESAFQETDVNPSHYDETLEYDTKTIITPHESIPDIGKWDCDEVCTYFRAIAPQFARLLKDNQIDGKIIVFSSQSIQL